MAILEYLKKVSKDLVDVYELTSDLIKSKVGKQFHELSKVRMELKFDFIDYSAKMYSSYTQKIMYSNGLYYAQKGGLFYELEMDQYIKLIDLYNNLRISYDRSSDELREKYAKELKIKMALCDFVIPNDVKFSSELLEVCGKYYINTRYYNSKFDLYCKIDIEKSPEEITEEVNKSVEKFQKLVSIGNDVAKSLSEYRALGNVHGIQVFDYYLGV